MYHVLPDTLEEIRASTLFKSIDYSKVPFSNVAQKIRNYCSEHDTDAHPEVEAVKFYVMNQFYSLVAGKYKTNEKISPEEYAALVRYVTYGGDVARRLIYYVLLISTRESRHVKNPNKMYEQLANIIPANELEEFKKFHSNYVTDGSSMPEKMHQHGPKMTIGNYIKCIEHIFYKGSFNSQYGGKPWGDIAKSARMVIYGELTFEMFADMAFALCHNGGPIFNKGMLYMHYNGMLLMKILDLQRAGKIPQWLSDGKSNKIPSSITGNDVIKSTLAAIAKYFPEVTNGNVDWSEVEKLGAVGLYETEKAEAEPAVPEENKYYVMPSVWAVKKERQVA